MLNELRNDRPAHARYCPCPSTVVAGDPVLIGGVIPAIALESYDAAGGGATFRFTGTYRLTVIAATVVSPITGSAVKNGDKIYATGTLDATTGVITDLVLSKATGGVLFGTYDADGINQGGILSGATDTAAEVMLKGGV